MKNGKSLLKWKNKSLKLKCFGESPIYINLAVQELCSVQVNNGSFDKIPWYNNIIKYRMKFEWINFRDSSWNLCEKNYKLD